MTSYLLPLYFVATLSSTYCLSLVLCKSDGKQVEIPMLRPGFKIGEKMEYRLHYGFINAGRAEISLHRSKEDQCIKAQVIGKSTGPFDMIIRIRDAWYSHIDTVSWLPQKAIRSIEEGNYKIKEIVTFNHTTLSAMVIREQPKKDKEINTYSIYAGSQDIVSGFYFLRRVNYDELHIGDTLALPVFFDKEKYLFRLRYMGKGIVKTDGGKFKGLKLIPIMPKNQLFNGEESIKVWISDDPNRIPLLAEAEMFVGSVQLELTGYQGLGNELSITR